MSPNSIGNLGEEPAKAIKMPLLRDDPYPAWSFARDHASKLPRKHELILGAQPAPTTVRSGLKASRT